MFKLFFRVLWIIASLAYVAYALISTDFFAMGDNPFESGYISFCLICALFALPTVVEHIRKEFEKAKKTESVQYSIYKSGSDGYRVKKESNLWISVFIIVAIEILFSPITLLITIIKNIAFITKSARDSKSDIGYKKKGYETKIPTSANDKYEGLEDADYYRAYEKAEKAAAKNILDPTFSGCFELPDIENFKILYRCKKGDIVYAIIIPESAPLEIENFAFVRVDPTEKYELFKYVYFLDPKDDKEFDEIDILMKKYGKCLNGKKG